MPDAANPVDFELLLTPNPDAPDELRAVGRLYWEYDGLDVFTDEIRWTRKVSDIDFKPWAGAAHFAAAAGVIAKTPTFACARCGGMLTLSSRQTLADARRSGTGE